MKEQNYGSWAFIIGLALALILGLFGNYLMDYQVYVSYLLVIIGLIVGFYNMGQKEVFNFLIVAIALLTVGAAGLNTIETSIMNTKMIETILSGIVAFVAPAALIMALKALYDLSYKK